MHYRAQGWHVLATDGGIDMKAIILGSSLTVIALLSLSLFADSQEKIRR